MASNLPIPAAAGVVTGLAGRSGRYLGGSFTFTAAGRIRLWSGPGAGTAPSAALLDEVNATAAGTIPSLVADNPMRGRQYSNGLYVELVSGVMPEGTVDISGPHS